MSIAEKAEKVKRQFLEELKELSDDSHQIKLFKDKFLGRKGLVSDLFSSLKNLPNEKKPEAGKILNSLQKFTLKN